MGIKENGIYRIYKIITLINSCCFLKIELLFLLTRLHCFNVLQN